MANTTEAVRWLAPSGLLAAVGVLSLVYTIATRAEDGPAPVPGPTSWPVAEPAPAPAGEAPSPIASPMPAPAPEPAPTPAPAPMPEQASPASRPVAAEPPQAVARYEGTPSPGLPIILDAGGSLGSDLRVRWVQTDGPPAAFDAEASRAQVIVPEGSGTLGFLLVASNAAGVDTARMTVPIVPRARTPEGSSLRAHAGDDQLGLVGRQVTLNGSGSEPAGQVGYRWLQVGGPPVRLKVQDGYIFTFTPTAPGVYRFALVVAAGSTISEPDEVTVTVGAPSAAAGMEAVQAAPETTQEVARMALAAIPGGIDRAEPLAEAMEAVASRMDLYQSYAELYHELSRRLDAIVPQEPARRNFWIERLFGPLTARLVESLRAEGLDLRQAESQAAKLAPNQRARFAEQFRAMAEGFRATVPPR